VKLKTRRNSETTSGRRRHWRSFQLIARPAALSNLTQISFKHP